MEKNKLFLQLIFVTTNHKINEKKNLHFHCNNAAYSSMQ